MGTLPEQTVLLLCGGGDGDGAGGGATERSEGRPRGLTTNDVRMSAGMERARLEGRGTNSKCSERERGNGYRRK